MDLINKIKENLKTLKDRLYGADESDWERVAIWEKELQKAAIIEDLGNHAGVKMLRESIGNFVKGLSEQVEKDRGPIGKSDKEKLEWFNNREMLYIKIDSYNWFLDLFAKASRQIEAIGRDVENEIK